LLFFAKKTATEGKQRGVNQNEQATGKKQGEVLKQGFPLFYFARLSKRGNYDHSAYFFTADRLGWRRYGEKTPVAILGEKRG